MANRNCPNCGAPYEITLNRCPYCQTAYYDMSALNLDNEEPFYLKMKVNGYYITQLVKPTCSNFELTSDTTYATSGRGNQKLLSFQTGIDFVTNLSFKAICKDKTYCTIEKEN